MAKKVTPKTTETPKDDKSNENEMTALPNDTTKMIVGERGLAFAVYVLYLLGYFMGITALIGVVIAYLQVGSANSEMKSHYTFQIKTFWIGLLYLFVGVLLLHVAVGGIILLWWFVWSLFRNVKGLLALNRNEPIANPESWMFGD
jgi:uncharacterized membrane protein